MEKQRAELQRELDDLNDRLEEAGGNVQAQVRTTDPTLLSNYLIIVVIAVVVVVVVLNLYIYFTIFITFKTKFSPYEPNNVICVAINSEKIRGNWWLRIIEFDF